MQRGWNPQPLEHPARVEADEHVVGPEGPEGHALDDKRAADLVQDRGAEFHSPDYAACARPAACPRAPMSATRGA